MQQSGFIGQHAMIEVILNTLNAVRYLSAPGGYGKTSSVLPAFIESTSMEGGGTHYL